MSINVCKEHKHAMTYSGEECPLCIALEDLRLMELLASKLKQDKENLLKIIHRQNIKLKNAGLIEKENQNG